MFGMARYLDIGAIRWHVRRSAAVPAQRGQKR
jgi:hypothetical protein